MADKNIEIIKAIQQTGKASTATVKTTKLVTEAYAPNLAKTIRNSSTTVFQKENNKKNP